MNSLPPLNLIDGALLIDNSWLETDTCPRRLQHRCLSKRVLSTTSTALNFGTAFHMATEYRRRQNNALTDELELNQCNLLLEFFDKNPPAEGDHRDLNYAIELFVTRYNRRYAKEPYELLRDAKGQIMVELPFILPLCDVTINGVLTPVLYIGKIDAPVKWDNHICIIDDKTSSFLGQDFWDDMAVRPQFLGYAWAFQTLTDLPVHSVCVNACRTASKPKYVIDYLEKKKSIVDDFAYIDTGKKTDPKKWLEETYQRNIIYIRPGQLEEWKNNIIARVEAFAFHYNRGYLPKVEQGNCVGKYGKCMFYEVCSLSPEQQSMVLNSAMFMDDKWTPLTLPSKSAIK